MATWDGSDQAGPSDDPNFYLYAHATNTAPNPAGWDYYSAGNGGYPHNSVGLYAQSNLPNAARNFQGSSYQEQPIYTPIENNPLVPVEQTCFFENNRPPQKFDNFNSQRHPAQGLNNDSLHTHSNLHAGATEFVPIANNLQKSPSSQSYNGSADAQYNDDSSKNQQGTSHIFFSDNRIRANDRRFDSAKNNSYRGSSYKGQRNRAYNNAPRGTDSSPIAQETSTLDDVPVEDGIYRGSKPQRTRNQGRFQNDRYSNRNRQQQEKPRPDRRKNPGESWENPSTSKGPSKEYTEGDQQQQTREISSHNAYNSRGRRETWTRNDRRFQNDSRYSGSKSYPSTNGYEVNSYEPQPSLASAGSRKEISQNRDSDRLYRNERTRGKNLRDGNYERSYQGYEGMADDRDIRYDRNGSKKSEYRGDEEPQSWRQKDKGPSRDFMPKRSNKRNEFDDDASQRERLTEQLNQGRLECLICCEYIRQIDPVWSCGNCHHVLHLKCLKKWAHSSQDENGWRCPACQNVSPTIPELYYCFCGKTHTPEWNRRDVAHSCGEICGRLRAKNNCVHKCTLLCHPGSCPECIAMVTRHCGCGRTSQSLKCSTTTLVVCEAICGKSLNCEIHTCEKTCHHGECGLCEKTFHQECYCGKHEREVTCTADLPSKYSCEEVCDKLLACGNHRCKALCHPDDCDSCNLQPALVTHCCCGQTPLTAPRESCLDPIPTCEKVCSKKLKCGQPCDPHTCKIDCHPGECPECELTTKVRCRCGNMDREIACKELRTKADDARCEKKCTKKRSCGKHKCNQLCCIDIEHICPMPCTKSLNCGRHRCHLCCHKGRCTPCQQMSFDELHCECGAAVIYPPVPCGTRRPTCTRPCTRSHDCDHEVLHNCHSDPTCPPCTVLTQKWCYGRHELRKAVPCHVNEISCGLACNKPISCGRHKCITLCHTGPCEKPGQVCTQPCTTPREMCGHVCAAPCHEGKCPDTPCKEMVKVTCTCGHRSTTRACAENSRDFQRIASGILASKMADMQLGHSVDLEEVFGQGAKKLNQLKTLECNDECKTIARNTKLAQALQSVNSDVSGKLVPRYTESMKTWAKKDPHFCQMVHDRLTELVQLAKTSKQKSRSYSFDSMNRDKRNFVHESCEHFGCESQAYDQEPKRNVVATAVKDKCWLPAYSLLEVVQRENGQRKVPRPMLNSSKQPTVLRLSKVQPSTARPSQTLQPSASSSSKSPEPEIDYFDFPTGKANKWSNV